MKHDLTIIGGGSILGFDAISLYTTIFGLDVLKIIKLSKNLRTPLIIFGGGFRKESDDLPERDRIHMKILFEKAVMKGVRGEISRDLLIKNHITDDVGVIGDPALSFNPIRVQYPLEKGFNIGMNVRYMKRRERQYIEQERIYEIFAQLADHFTDAGAKIYFFSFTENIFDSDVKAAKRVISRMKNRKAPVIIPFSKNVMEVCSLIGKFDYLISHRLHPCILGWVQKVPSVAFDYQFSKTADFMQSINMDEFIIRTDEFTFESYFNKYSKIKDNKNAIISCSQNKIDYWRRKQKDFAQHCLNLMIDNGLKK